MNPRDNERDARLRSALLDWYRDHRRDLPWRGEADPYRVWVSEVMLQQTRVDTVVPYYERWLDRFPTLAVLADADGEEVLATWAGLGYYRRARDLHAAARVVRDRHGGRVPSEPAELRALPGVGAYTAGAVASIAFGRRAPAVDVNARRVLSRLFDLPRPTATALESVAGRLVPAERPGVFNQALMELGATVCAARSPECAACPVSRWCRARARGTVAERPARGRRARAPSYRVGTAIVVGRGGRILMARRPAEGLLGGMWEFPGAVAGPRESAAAAALRVARALLGPAIRLPLRPRAEARIAHAYSHRRHVYHAFRFDAATGSRPRARAPRRSVVGGAVVRGAAVAGAAAWTALAWETPADLATLPMGSAQRAIASALRVKMPG